MHESRRGGAFVIRDKCTSGVGGSPYPKAPGRAESVNTMYTREEIEQRVRDGLSCAGFDLRGTSFDGANLAGGNFEGANFQGCSMRGVNLSYANLRKANLSGVDLGPLPRVIKDASASAESDTGHD